jgi:methyl-accepting chemotaxis protein
MKKEKVLKSFKKISLTLIFIIIMLSGLGTFVFSVNLTNALPDLSSYTPAQQQLILRMVKIAVEYKSKVEAVFDEAIGRNKLKLWQVFDTFYIPVQVSQIKKILGSRWTDAYYSFPISYTTEYDSFTDSVFMPIQDAYLEKHTEIVFLLIQDRHGYIPTHNSRFNRPFTGDMLEDLKHHRSKRIYIDIVAQLGARNVTRNVLVQKYYRDTGEMMADISSPVFIKGRHWGCVRLAITLK